MMHVYIYIDDVSMLNIDCGDHVFSIFISNVIHIA